MPRKMPGQRWQKETLSQEDSRSNDGKILVTTPRRPGPAVSMPLTTLPLRDAGTHLSPTFRFGRLPILGDSPVPWDWADVIQLRNNCQPLPSRR